MARRTRTRSTDLQEGSERPPAKTRRTDARAAKSGKTARQAGSRKSTTSTVGPLTVTEVEALDDLRRELERVSRSPARWNADPEDVQRSVAQLVLTLV